MHWRRERTGKGQEVHEWELVKGTQMRQPGHWRGVCTTVTHTKKGRLHQTGVEWEGWDQQAHTWGKQKKARGTRKKGTRPRMTHTPHMVTGPWVDHPPAKPPAPQHSGAWSPSPLAPSLGTAGWRLPGGLAQRLALPLQSLLLPRLQGYRRCLPQQRPRQGQTRQTETAGAPWRPGRLQQPLAVGTAAVADPRTGTGGAAAPPLPPPDADGGVPPAAAAAAAAAARPWDLSPGLADGGAGGMWAPPGPTLDRLKGPGPPLGRPPLPRLLPPEPGAAAPAPTPALGVIRYMASSGLVLTMFRTSSSPYRSNFSSGMRLEGSSSSGSAGPPPSEQGPPWGYGGKRTQTVYDSPYTTIHSMQSSTTSQQIRSLPTTRTGAPTFAPTLLFGFAGVSGRRILRFAHVRLA